MSAWGNAWGDAWGAAWGAPGVVVISGSGAVEQECGESHGVASIPGAALPVVAPDAYPGAGGVPSTYLLRESAQRNGFILTGDGQVEQLPSESHGGARIKVLPLVATATASQPCGDASGAARIKLVSLVAMSASAAHGAGQVAAIGEFRDIELEMVAMLLAA